MKRTVLSLALALLCANAALAALAATSGLDRSAADPAVPPQQDLFRAVNGGWLKSHDIPADKASWGAFHELDELSTTRVREIAEELAKNPPANDANARKIADFYRSVMDVEAIDQRGIAPIEPVLKEIDALATPADLARYFGRQQGRAKVPVMVEIGQDDKDATRYQFKLHQSGLGLPDRDYYLKSDAKLKKAQEAYLQYLETLLNLAGDPDAKAHAATVFALETKLAKASWDKVTLRNPQKIYNKRSVAEFAKLAPGFDWPAFLEGAGVPGLDSLNARSPSYFAAMAKLVKNEPVASWKLYLKAHALDSAALVLPKSFRDASFAYHQKALSGVPQEKPRWKHAVTSLNIALSEAVGQVYVARHFPPEHKAKMEELVSNLMKAYRQSIDGLTWMTDATKAKARDKLAKYTVKIGYPSQWRDYAKLDIRAGDPVGNDLRAGRFEYERNIAKLGKPIDRTEWGMPPQMVNAYYDPNMNDIVFPAAILQPPFFDPKADDAVNYGGIGAVIGHEISHGFDDEGSQYDGDGNLKSWWTPADRKAFEALGAKLVKQYDGYEAVPGHKINGKLTLGENIADLSGLQIAYKAYKLSLGGKEAPVIDNLSGDQRLFMGFAQVWRNKMRDEAKLRQVLSDPHSPAEFRANGAAVNADGFHSAFQTKPGDGMYKSPTDRIRIW